MIPFQSALSSIKDIEQRNIVFNEVLTDEEKRKEIAFEAAMLVLCGLVTPSECGYWSPELCELRFKDGKEIPHHLRNTKSSKELQNALLNELPKPEDCQVCQRGLMMIAQIRLGNSLPGNCPSVSTGNNTTIKGFSVYDFIKMEGEFENFDSAGYMGTPYSSNTKEKLLNICCNVIANGNFMKTDRTDYIEKWDLKFKNKNNENDNESKLSIP